jgi:hypothetical protein
VHCIALLHTLLLFALLAVSPSFLISVLQSQAQFQALQLTPREVSRLQKIFSKIDSDNSGYVEELLLDV